MHEKTIKKYIEKLNRGRTNNLIFIRPLSSNVDYSKLWDAEPKPNGGSTLPPETIYFIKDEFGKYIGAVIDMQRDLHWFLLPKFRKLKIMSSALRKTILPHLFQDREVQRVTIDIHSIGGKNFAASEKLALSVGFNKSNEVDGKSEYTMEAQAYNDAHYIEGQNTEISKERLKALQNKLKYLARSLWLVQTEVEMLMGDEEFAEDLKELVDLLYRKSIRMEDAWWNSKKDN